MRPEGVEKLLGGYATGTLTEAECNALFEAALANQDLFDALADEEALRELLADPGARRHLLEQLAEKKSLGRLQFGWWNRRLAWGMAGSVVVTVLLVVILVPVYRRLAPGHFAAPPAAPVEVAQKITPPAQPGRTPAAARPRAITPARPAPAAQPARAEAEVARQAPPAEKPEQAEGLAAAPRPVAGGTPGGVIGGIIQAPPTTVAEARQALPQAAELKKLEGSAFRPPETRTLGPAALDEAQPEARALFYSWSAAPARGKPTLSAAEQTRARTAPPAPALGLRYTILRKDRAGRYAEVAPDSVFQRGDSLRLSVGTNQAGILQLLAQDPAGAWRLVQQVTLAPRSRQILPAEDAPALRGPQRLRLVFSAAPEKLKLRDQPASRAVVQKVPEEKAVYAISQGPGPVSVDIELRQQ